MCNYIMYELFGGLKIQLQDLMGIVSALNGGRFAIEKIEEMIKDIDADIQMKINKMVGEP